MSLYQQRPGDEEGNIWLREYWRCWPHGKPKPTATQMANPQATMPPHCYFIVLVYDTAFAEGEDNDYSAMTCWGLFEQAPLIDDKGIPAEATIMMRDPDGNPIKDPYGQAKIKTVKIPQMCLLGGWRGKVNAAELMDHCEGHVKLWRPDLIIVENKSSGIQLLQEMRLRRWPAQGWPMKGHTEPAGTKGKIPSLWKASYIAELGVIWYMPGPVSDKIIDEVSSAPYGRYWDWTDTVRMATLWLRDFGFLQVPTDIMTPDEEAEEEYIRHESTKIDRPLYGHMRVKGERGRRWEGEKRRLYGGG
jgi:hypothetical protein